MIIFHDKKTSSYSRTELGVGVKGRSV